MKCHCTLAKIGRPSPFSDDTYIWYLKTRRALGERGEGERITGKQSVRPHENVSGEKCCGYSGLVGPDTLGLLALEPLDWRLSTLEAGLRMGILLWKPLLISGCF